MMGLEQLEETGTGSCRRQESEDAAAGSASHEAALSSERRSCLLCRLHAQPGILHEISLHKARKMHKVRVMFLEEICSVDVAG